MRPLLHQLFQHPWKALQWIALLTLLVGLVVLGRLEAGGVTHADLELDDGTPATLYLPGRAIEHWLLPNPPAPGRRPPGVLITHAFGADRATMSTLARRLARNGYAALAIDLPGHGTNERPFPVGRGRTDQLGPILETALSFLGESGYADAGRLALVGHSVGAIGVLEYATHADKVAATVLMSVGILGPGDRRAPNLLLLYGAWDAGWMADSAQRLAARHAGVDAVPLGATRGSHEDRTAVRIERIPRADHFAIVLSRRTAEQIISWLDASFGLTRTAPLQLADPRWIVMAVASIAVLVLLFGLGDLLGALAPRWPADDEGGGVRALGLLAAVFALTLPVMSTAERLAWFVGLEALDTLLPQLALIGALLFAVEALRPSTLTPIARSGRLRGIAVAALGAGLMYAALAPLAVVVRRLTPTSDRLLALALTLPFLTLLFLALDLLLRRGAPLRAALWSVIGRALIVALWIAGVELRIVPPLTVVIAPLFLILLVPLEVVAWRIYSGSRNLVVTAVFESLVFGWLVTMLLPLRL